MLVSKINDEFVSLKWVDLIHEGRFRDGSQWCFMGISGWAFVRVWIYNTMPDVGFVTDFSVVDERRNMGIGTAMLECVEVHARSKGIKVIRLEVDADDESAKEFYRKRDYAETSDSGENPGYREVGKEL